jgi:uncharacterized protein YfaS (alpha-2-macroglobulin family)
MKRGTFFFFVLFSFVFFSGCEKEETSSNIPPEQDIQISQEDSSLDQIGPSEHSYDVDIDNTDNTNTDNEDIEEFFDFSSLPESKPLPLFPEITSSSLPKESNEIGRKSPLRFSFNQEMNKESVERAFIIEPKIFGHFSWNEEGTTATFTPEEPYEAGKKYSITLSTDALSREGKNLPEEYLRSIRATNELKILAVIPESGEISPSTDISIIFNQPIFELGILDELEKHDFGIQVTPSFPFRYHLAGTNTLQIQGQMPSDAFVDHFSETSKKIEHRLPRSTHIRVTIPKDFTALNGTTLSESKTFSLTTTPLSLLTKNVSSIHPFSPLILRFNQPVDLESVQKHVHISLSSPESKNRKNPISFPKLPHDEVVEYTPPDIPTESPGSFGTPKTNMPSIPFPPKPSHDGVINYPPQDNIAEENISFSPGNSDGEDISPGSFGTPKTNMPFPQDPKDDVLLEKQPVREDIPSDPDTPLPRAHAETDYIFQYTKTKEGTDDETRVEIFPKTKFWQYDASYSVTITSGIVGKEGNIFTKEKVMFPLRTKPFVMLERDVIGPNQELTLLFDQAPDSLNDISSHLTTNGGNYTLQYRERCKDPKKRNSVWEQECEKEDDMKKVVLTFSSPLQTEITYALSLRAGLSVMITPNNDPYSREFREHSWHGKQWNLDQDTLLSFSTPEKPKILGSYAEEENYRLLCLYSNNKLDATNLQKNIQFSPPLPQDFFSISQGIVPVRSQNRKNDIQGCDHPEYVGKHRTEIHVRMDFETDYTIELLENALDIYKQPLREPFTFSHKTGPLQERDVSLHLMSSHRNVIAPAKSNPTVVFASQNILDALQVDICRTSTKHIIEKEERIYNYYQDDSWFPDEKSCEYFESVSLPVPRKPWEKQYTEVNIQEILGENFSKGVYVIAAHHPKVQQTIYERGMISKHIPKKVPTYVSQIVQVTDLSVITKQDGKSLIIWANKLSDGAPLEKANVSWVTREWEGSKYIFPEKAIGTTDSHGILKTENNNAWTYIIVQHGDDTIALGSNWKISPWRQGVQQEYPRAYIFTDRPIYRPGDVVHGKGIFIRDYDASYSFAKMHPVSLTVKDRQRKELLKEKKLTTDTMGSVSFSFPIPQDASLGEAQLEFLDHGYVRYPFTIEEYKKPEIEVAIAAENSDYAAYDIANISASAKYYFGSPVKGGTGKYSLKRTPFVFDQYRSEEGYIFGEQEFNIRPFFSSFPEKNWHGAEYLKNEEHILSEEGTLALSEPIELPIIDPPQKTHPKEERIIFDPVLQSSTYTAELTVEDTNKNPVFASTQFVAHATQHLVGVKPEQYSGKAKEKFSIHIITVDTKGNPLEGKKVHITVVSQESIQEEEKGRGLTHARWIPPWRALKETIVFEQGVTSNTYGKAQTSFLPQEGGRYKVVAEVRDGNNQLQRSSMTVFIIGENAVQTTSLQEKRIDIISDKQEYEIGDTAVLTFLSPLDNKNAKYLLGYEREKIHKMGIANITDGNTLSVHITENMIPNMGVTLTGQQFGDNPALAFGEIDLSISTKTKELDIDVQPNKEHYLPGEKVQLSIQTESTSDLAVIVVDKANIDMFDSARKNIHTFFYEKRKIVVETIASLLRLNTEIEIPQREREKLEYEDAVDMERGIAMERVAKDVSLLAAEDERNAKMAGAPVQGALSQKKRTNFQDTAFFQGIVKTDKNGNANIEFTLPDNLTTWKILTIGINHSFQVGEHETEVTTKKPLLLRPQLPRFIRYGDHIEIRANIHNETDRDMHVVVYASVENISLEGTSEREILISANSSQEVSWNVNAKEKRGAEKARITLKAESQQFLDETELSIPIRMYSVPETVASAGITSSFSHFEKVRLPEYVEKNLGKLQIQTSATLAHFLHSGLSYLIDYPYGCNEQIASKLLGLMTYHHITQLPNISGKIPFPGLRDENDMIISYEEAVKEAVQKLLKNQRFDGGWGYWVGSQETSLPLTAYIFHVLDTASKYGESIDPSLINGGREFLEKYLTQKKDLPRSMIEYPHQANTRAYILFILSSQNPNGEALSKLTDFSVDHQDKLSSLGEAYLLLHLQNTNTHKDIKKTLLTSLQSKLEVDSRGMFLSPEKDGWHYNLHNSGHKLTALFVKAMVSEIDEEHISEDQILSKMIRWLTRSRKEGRWHDTQATITVIDAFSDYLQKSKEHLAEYDATILIDGKKAKEYHVNGDTLFDTHHINIRTEDLLKKGDSGLILQFLKEGKKEGTLYYDIILQYYLPILQILAREEGISVQRQLFKQTDTDAQTPIQKGEKGEVLRGVLTVSVPSERRFVAVTNPIPSGTELINFRLKISDQRIQKQAPSGKYTNGISSRGHITPYRSYWSPWVHTEMRDDALLLFADYLSPGVYTYEYSLRITHSGMFAHPPARAEEMYFPEIFGRSKGEIFEGISEEAEEDFLEEPPSEIQRTYSRESFSFSYSEELSLSENEADESLVLQHSIPHHHEDPCDFKGDGIPLENLMDFHVSVKAFPHNIHNTVTNIFGEHLSEYFLEENQLQVQPGFIESVEIGENRGFRVISGIEGCGEYVYLFPINGRNTLVLKRAFITELLDSASPFSEEYLELPGIISPDQEEEMFQNILESLRFSS